MKRIIIFFAVCIGLGCAQESKFQTPNQNQNQNQAQTLNKKQLAQLGAPETDSLLFFQTGGDYVKFFESLTNSQSQSYTINGFGSVNAFLSQFYLWELYAFNDVKAHDVLALTISGGVEPPKVIINIASVQEMERHAKLIMPHLQTNTASVMKRVLVNEAFNAALPEADVLWAEMMSDLAASYSYSQEDDDSFIVYCLNRIAPSLEYGVTGVAIPETYAWAFQAYSDELYGVLSYDEAKKLKQFINNEINSDPHGNNLKQSHIRISKMYLSLLGSEKSQRKKLKQIQKKLHKKLHKKYEAILLADI